MTRDGPAVERLRDYLQTLTPQARGMLIAELERAVERGEQSAANELILQELRRAIGATAEPPPRIGGAAELFFAPLASFIVEDASDQRRIGRIARTSLGPIWE